MMKNFRFLMLMLAMISLPQKVLALEAVIDTAAIAKLTDQLTKMQKQIEVLTDVSGKIQEQIDAAGKFGQITLPIVSAAKIASQVRQGLVCLRPDFSKLMPNIDFEELNMDTICQASNVYEQTLWVDPKKLNKIPTWQERNAAIQAVRDRRERILQDAASKGLATADIASKESEDTNKAADEIDAAADSATNQRAQLRVLQKALAMLMRGQAKEQQIQAQQLKVMSAVAIKMGVPPESLMSQKEEKK